MEKKNTGLIILVIVLAVAVLSLSGFIIYDKVLNNNVKDNEIKENVILEENKIIELNYEEKVKINSALNNLIPTLHMNLLGEHEIGKNVLSTQKEKFEFVYWYLIHIKYYEGNNNFKNIYDNEIKEYRTSIKLSYIHEIYKEIFNSDFDDSVISKDLITTDKYVYTPMAWGGGYPGTLKVNNLLLNEKTGEYSLYVDILSPNNLTVEIPVYPFNDMYIEYDSSLIKESAVIKYKELNGKKILTSWVYAK